MGEEKVTVEKMGLSGGRITSYNSKIGCQPQVNVHEHNLQARIFHLHMWTSRVGGKVQIFLIKNQ